MSEAKDKHFFKRSLDAEDESLEVEYPWCYECDNYMDECVCATQKHMIAEEKARDGEDCLFWFVED